MNESDFFTVVDRGVREGVLAALRDHKRSGYPLYVWRNGKIIEIPPGDIPVDDRDAHA